MTQDLTGKTRKALRTSEPSVSSALDKLTDFDPVYLQAAASVLRDDYEKPNSNMQSAKKFMNLSVLNVVADLLDEIASE